MDVPYNKDNQLVQTHCTPASIFESLNDLKTKKSLKMEALHLQQTILNKEILDHVVSKIAQGQAQDAVIENLLGIGVAVVTRVQSSQDVDFVKVGDFT